jgi:hypothetical protein
MTLGKFIDEANVFNDVGLPLKLRDDVQLRLISNTTMFDPGFHARVHLQPYVDIVQFKL